MLTFKALLLLYVPPDLTDSKIVTSTRGEFMLFVLITEQAAVISPIQY
jgi:hypothetical protein